VYATSGSNVYVAGVALAISSDFTIGAASGSQTSQKVNAGATANFSLVLAAAPSFSGTVNLSCAITPVVTPAPTCTPSSSSVQLSSGGSQQVSVTVGTTAPVTTSNVPNVLLPRGVMPLAFTMMLIVSGWFWLCRRKRWSVVLSPVLLAVLVVFVSCGGNGGEKTTDSSPGTPAGTYTATVMATSGSISHQMTLQLVVQ